ncbi:hypothetical protein [Luteolibacter sp. LG18]|uniref:hypothetical protein n=1 Tax=Luteolibacter sp. LG18 TaxID=2819286 RepID=UPI002B30A190|nr:hypothetical protein llg_25360 [Luteolibacter sp. LG18]
MPSLVTALAFVAACIVPTTLAAAEPTLRPDILEEIGKELDERVSSFEVPIEGKGCTLRIHKNGQDTGSFPLDRYNHLTVIVISGKGLQSRPRQVDAPETILLRMLAKGPNGEAATFTASYEVPEGATETTTKSSGPSVLFERIDRKGMASSGTLKVWLDRTVEPEKPEPAR